MGNRFSYNQVIIIAEFSAFLYYPFNFSFTDSISLNEDEIFVSTAERIGPVILKLQNRSLNFDYFQEYFPESTGLIYTDRYYNQIEIFPEEGWIEIPELMYIFTASYRTAPKVKRRIEDLIEDYYMQSYSQMEICNLLAIDHQIPVSLRTLQRYFRVLGLKRKNIIESPVEAIVAAIVLEVNSSGINLGYRSMWRRLKSKYHLIVKQATVLKYLRIVDPEGIELRSRYRLKRRTYLLPGPNYMWHMDGYDKLKPYGFAIYALIDGYSRKILYMAVSTTNNKPEVIAHYFTIVVLEHGCVPTILRVDAGTENPLTGLIQQALRHYHEDEDAGPKSYFVGPSTHNQRIERFWGEGRRIATGYYIDLFKTLIGKRLLNTKDVVDIECLRFCFGRVIQNDLLRVKEEWNAHPIRCQNSTQTPTGKPNILFKCPERYNATDCRKNVNIADVKRIQDNFCTVKPIFYNRHTPEIARLLIPNYKEPETPVQASDLYIDLQKLLNENVNARNSLSEALDT